MTWVHFSKVDKEMANTYKCSEQ